LKTQFTEAEFRAIVAKVGCAIVAPSPDIAPADQRLYAVRDVTGTVRSRDLITASILAKKLAAGLEGLVLDVKTGSGAVMSDLGQARDLAQALVATANGAGCPTSAVLTDMSQPLIPSIGNALEIADVMRAFESGQGAMVEVALELGTQLLLQTQMFLTETGARDGLKATLQDGSAKARFGAMVRAQGGPENFADRWQDYLEIAPAYELRSPGTGYLAEMDGAALGQAVVALGGGRQREDDRIDHSVGLSDIAPLGTHLRKGALIARLHCRSSKQAEMAMRAVQGAVTLSAEPPVLPALIIERITPTKVSKHG
jgi:thymidine phosphorylase